MEILTKIKNYILVTIDQASVGLSLLEITVVVTSLILALIIRGFFAKIILSKIKKIIFKTASTIDDKLFDTLLPPLKFLPILLVFILMGFLVNVESQIGLFLEKINQTLVTTFIFWIFHQSLVPLSQAFQKLEVLLSKALVSWLTRSLKYLIIFLGTVAVLETWNIKIGPVIAGLGLFGVAVALGAQDLFKNLISGIMIILERRFEINDTIEVPGHTIGTVEHIGFRSTLIRKFDTTSISIPNYVFSDTSIINFSDREYRRIKWIIGLNYDTSIDDLKKICKSIDTLIRSSNEFIVNDKYQLFVRVEKFNDSSIDVLVYTFASTNEWKEYLIIKEKLALNIKEIVENSNSSFAFPSQSIYVEKK